MSRETRSSRYLSPRTLDALWAGEPMAIQLDGDPPCQILLDSKLNQCTLLTANEEPQPDVRKLKNVDALRQGNQQPDTIMIVVSVDSNVHGAYGFLASIADQLQLDQIPLATAVDNAVRTHRDLVAIRDYLTAEQEIGLFGELLLLNHLIDRVGVGNALDSWLGPSSEEHDFVLDKYHLEVKTTSSERRQHVIGSVNQLLRLGDTPLYLVSIQLTRSTAAVGSTLPSLIAHTQAKVGGHVVRLDQCLHSAGWSAGGDDLYPNMWTLRSPPRAYLVDKNFPALTAARLQPFVPSFNLISDIQYRINLTTFDHVNPGAPVSEFVNQERPET